MEPFKEKLNEATARSIADAVVHVYPAFDRKRFLRGLKENLAPLELKARVHFIATRLTQTLPESPAKCFPVLVNAVEESESFEGFAAWPFTEVVARNGLNHFALSMRTLARLTPHFTAEFAMRPFLKQHLDATLRQLLKWTAHKNEHVRRLASEGCRPNLPWGGKLPELLQNPQFTLPILDQLHADPSPYVRLSVANHLNDFSTAAPDHVKQCLRRWAQEKCAHHATLARRALRTLIKRGDPEAFQLLGIEQSEHLELTDFRLKTDSIPWNGRLEYECRITNYSDRTSTALFDFAMHFLRSNGTLTRKVFRGRKFELSPQATKRLTGSYSFRPITTRTYYPGPQAIEPIVNGASGPRVEFMLQSP